VAFTGPVGERTRNLTDRGTFFLWNSSTLAAFKGEIRQLSLPNDINSEVLLI